MYEVVVVVDGDDDDYYTKKSITMMSPSIRNILLSTHTHTQSKIIRLVYSLNDPNIYVFFYFVDILFSKHKLV